MNRRKRVLVVGAGELGIAVVEVLWEGGAEVVVLDRSDEAVEACRSRASAAYVGDGSDPRTLESIGAAEMDVAVVTFGEHFEAAVLSVASLVRLGVPEVMARATTDRKAEVLRTLGAHRVLRVERETGRRLGAGLLSGTSVELWDLAAGYRVAPWVVPPELEGRTVEDLALRRKLGINALGFWQRGVRPGAPDAVMNAVEPTYRFLTGDTLLLVGPAAAIEKFLSQG